MTARPSTWAVVATVDEPPGLVTAFAAWYLQLGAAAVYLYFDRPDDPAAGMLRDTPGVCVATCDAAHWARLGKRRPRRHEVRQVKNANDAYQRSQADWLLHCDADEFLAPVVPVPEVLETLPGEVDSLVVPVAERMHGPEEAGAHVFEGMFRRPFRGPVVQGRALFGASYDLTYRGMTGYAHGKVFTRVGRPARLSIHRAKPTEGASALILSQGLVDQFELLHFEGLSPLHWEYKLRRLLRDLDRPGMMPPSPHRARQTAALVESQDGAALYTHLKRPADKAVQALVARALVREPFPLLGDTLRQEGRLLTPADVDVWIKSEKADIMAHAPK